MTKEQFIELLNPLLRTAFGSYSQIGEVPVHAQEIKIDFDEFINDADTKAMIDKVWNKFSDNQVGV